MIDDLVEDESRIEIAIRSMDLSESEKLILQVLFTEKSLQEAEHVLQKYFGLRDGKKSIDKALTLAKKRIMMRMGHTRETTTRPRIPRRTTP